MLGEGAVCCSQKLAPVRESSQSLNDAARGFLQESIERVGMLYAILSSENLAGALRETHGVSIGGITNDRSI
jgi:hypothetical protein